MGGVYPFPNPLPGAPHLLARSFSIVSDRFRSFPIVVDPPPGPQKGIQKQAVFEERLWAPVGTHFGPIWGHFLELFGGHFRALTMTVAPMCLDIVFLSC